MAIRIAADTVFTLPALFPPDPRAPTRTLESLTARIRNPHARRTHGRAVAGFAAWSEEPGITALQEVGPVHVEA
jgi:hypothetical protein